MHTSTLENKLQQYAYAYSCMHTENVQVSETKVIETDQVFSKIRCMFDSLNNRT